MLVRRILAYDFDTNKFCPDFIFGLTRYIVGCGFWYAVDVLIILFHNA